MLQFFRKERMWRSHLLKDRYDVVIIGAGVHGLATAYYLGEQGVTNVAVLDKGYLGSGNSGRNTAIIRANYRTPKGFRSITRVSDFTKPSRRSWAITCCSPSKAT